MKTVRMSPSKQSIVDVTVSANHTESSVPLVIISNCSMHGYGSFKVPEYFYKQLARAVLWHLRYTV